MKKIIVSVLCIAMLLSLFGCSTKVESISVTGGNFLKVGETTELVATVLPEDATDKGILYESSDTTVATVDETGIVTAVKGGTVDITVKTSNTEVFVVHTITVIPEIESINAPAEVEVMMDEYIDVGKDTTITPENADKAEVEYISADTNIATVSDTGVVTGINVGETTVTASANGIEAVVVVKVHREAYSITLDKESATITVKGTDTLTATVLPEDADIGIVVTWTSSDESIATVDTEGKVTAVKAGTAVISASTDNGLTAECTVTVKKATSTSGNKGTSGTSGGAGTSGGTTSGGNSTGGTSTNGGLSDAEISNIVASARAYARGLGFSAGGGLRPSWSVPTQVTGTYDQVLQSVKWAIDDTASYFDTFLSREEWAGTGIAIEYIAGGAGGTGIYVSY